MKEKGIFSLTPMAELQNSGSVFIRKKPGIR